MSNLELWSENEFVSRLRNVGTERYHSLHPFNIAMNEGRLTPDEIKRWVFNRFYYQTRIPMKDAAILSNCPLRDVRRAWMHRILDHDGTSDAGGGGMDAWLRLGSALEIEAEEMLDHRHVAPGARFAVDAYVQFAKSEPWPIAVASSLTELFAPMHMKIRVEGMEKHYSWIPVWGYDYFRGRITQAAVDSGEALLLTVKYCDTPELQRRAVAALEFKCDVLWCLLDAVQGVDAAK